MKRLSAAFAAGLIVVASASAALADNYTVKNSAGVTVTMGAKSIGGILYPENMCAGVYSGALLLCNMDGSGNLGVNVISSALPTGAATSANQSSQITQETASATGIGTPADATWSGSGNASLIAALKAVWITDAPFQGVVAMTVGTNYTAQRSVGANCTGAGNMSVTLADASTLIVPVQAGWQTFPFAVTTVNTSGTTATCTYSNLK